jgi:hypothetical protein
MRQDPATADRNRDTGPLPPLPTLPSGGDDPIAKPPSRRRQLLIVAALAVVLIGGIATLVTVLNNPMNDQRPVAVVQGFAAAVEAKDPSKMLSYVEPTRFRKEIGPEIRSYVAYIESIRFVNPQYQLLENDGRRALVRWTATAEYTLRELGSGQRPVDTTFELVNLEGAWYLRSIELPTR